MAVLHMDTEAVRGVGTQLGQSAESLRQQGQQLRTATSRLAAEWDGGSADMFDAEMQILLQKLGQSAEAGTLIQSRLNKEISEWLEVASILGSNGGQLRTNDQEKNIFPENQIIEEDKGFLGNLRNKAGEFVTGVSATAGHIKDGIGDVLNRGGDIVDDLSQKIIKQTDNVSNLAFEQLLSYQGEGSTERLTLTMERGAVIDGIKIEAGNEVEITRNPDGTYNVVVQGSGGAGLKASTPSAEMKIGGRAYGTGPSASVEAVESVAFGISYKFDPNNTGDMTEMAGMLAMLGMTTQMPPFMATALTPISTGGSLINNIDGIQFGHSVEGEANASFSHIVELAGIDFKSELGQQGQLAKNDLGQWELSSEVYRGGGVSGHVSDHGLGVDAKFSAQLKTNLETHASSTVFAIEVGADADLRSFKIDGLELPSVKHTASGKLIVEYTLSEPFETIKDTIITPDGIPNLDALAKNSHVEVKLVQGNAHEIGLEGTVGIAGLEAEGSIARESISTIYPP